MKLIIDLQACQSPESRNRGIGRYSHSLAQSIAHQAQDHDLWLFLTDVHSEAIETIRKNYDGLVPQEKIIVWQTPELSPEFDRASIENRISVEAAREAFLASLNPDFVHVSSLFETHGNCITSIGHIEPRPANSVTLYDLIPLVHKERYLVDENAYWWYMRKISQLKNADLLLAISEYSRKEAIEHLSIESNTVVTILGAADAHFKKITFPPDQIAKVHSRYGLVRPFVMYTGGIDFRKNIEGLISSFARLPRAVRQKHQIAVVCKVLDTERELLMSFAAKEGMAADELVITGFIPEHDLVVLYNTCKLFIFPSWHEGFGLPVLEAMSCGAPVITANTTCLPEIVGRPDAMFDPHDLQSITSKIAQSLSDLDFRTSLILSGLEQAKKFTWDNTGKLALTAFEEKVLFSKKSNRKSIALQGASKPKLAFVSPMPPERTGIANYSAQLLPFLADHFDIDVIVEQPIVSEVVIPLNCNVRDASWFMENGNSYKHIIYHFGNSLFHQYMNDLIEKYPGVVCLHDFYLSGPPAHLDLSAKAPAMWAKALFHSHSYRSIRDICKIKDFTSLIHKYPCNRKVLEAATSVIVHSEHALRLCQQWFGLNSTNSWHVIPLIRIPKYINKLHARALLGLDKDIFICCSFGMITSSKFTEELIQAWSSASLKGRSKLIFVGESGDEEYLQNINNLLQSKSESINNISITGFIDNNNYALYLAAADIAVQLRRSSRGETSAAALDCMGVGLPLIVNSHGTMAEFPENVVLKISDQFTQNELVIALETLNKDAIRCMNLNFNASNWFKNNNSPTSIALKYKNTILGSSKSPDALLINCKANMVEGIQIDDKWKVLAKKSLTTYKPSFGARQLFVDISVLNLTNANTGIQKVVISYLKEMMLNPSPGLFVEPVYLDSGGNFNYARKFCSTFMDYGYLGFAIGLYDEPIVIRAQDVFLGLDLCLDQIYEYENSYKKFRELGIKVIFFIYDIIPITHPEWFNQDVSKKFQNWLSVVTKISDEVICISEYVAEQFSLYCCNQAEVRNIKINTLKIGTFYYHEQAYVNDPNPLDQIYSSTNNTNLIKDSPTKLQFLMVGTLEPRKGHAQILDAFEMLWRKGHQFKLVIVGKLGWGSDDLERKITHNHKFGKLLQWGRELSDDEVVSLYKSSTAFIAASYEEGLGLPILEASAFGLPILARDIPVFKEIAGDSATYFQGDNADTVAKAILTWVKLSIDDKVPDSLSINQISVSQSASILLNIVT